MHSALCAPFLDTSRKGPSILIPATWDKLLSGPPFCFRAKLPISLKILRKLVAEGIVRSYKGTQGGYELARPAGEISLGEVIEVVEGPITISRCVGVEGFKCSRGEDSFCQFNQTYSEISKMVREKLYAVHFGEE